MFNFQPTQLSHLNGKLVLNYKLKGTLGEGGFGKVKLAEALDTGKHIAIKIISKKVLNLKLAKDCNEALGLENKENHPPSNNSSGLLSNLKEPKLSLPLLLDDYDEKKDPVMRKCSLPSLLEKEVTIHKAIRHPNIIQLLDYCGNQAYIFLLMEWASGGELFDKIIPDVGLPEDVTHFFFRQLTSAVEYLHKNGIAHRDLKPENLLLDAHGNLKLTDFGLATIFKYKGKTRKLNSICGSPVYLAPEVLQGPYDGDLADLWSMGVILFVMYKGVTPWSEPTTKCYDFGDYLFSRYDGGPLPSLWETIPFQLRTLIFGLVSVPKLRMSMDQLKKDPWLNQFNSLFNSNGLCSNVLLLAQKMCDPKGSCTTISTQPELSSTSFSFLHDLKDPNERTSNELDDILSFSQPTIYFSEYSPEKTPPPLSFLSGQPLTRFFTMTPPKDFMISLSQRFTDLRIQHTPITHSTTYHFHFSLMDNKRCPIQGHVRIQPVSKSVWMVLFIRKKGDPLEFKKVFQKTLEGCTWNVLTRFNDLKD